MPPSSSGLLVLLSRQSSSSSRATAPGKSRHVRLHCLAQSHARSQTREPLKESNPRADRWTGWARKAGCRGDLEWKKVLRGRKKFGPGFLWADGRWKFERCLGKVGTVGLVGGSALGDGLVPWQGILMSCSSFSFHVHQEFPSWSSRGPP